MRCEIWAQPAGLGPNLTSHSTPDEQANHQLSMKEKAGVMKPPKTPNTKPSIYMFLTCTRIYTCKLCKTFTYEDFMCICVYIVVSYLCRILCVCHGVLYKQLSAWMLHGLLLDKKGEFFIERVQPSAPAEVHVHEHS